MLTREEAEIGEAKASRLTVIGCRGGPIERRSAFANALALQEASKTAPTESDVSDQRSEVRSREDLQTVLVQAELLCAEWAA